MYKIDTDKGVLGLELGNWGRIFWFGYADWTN
jgi:hypothetical protein